MTQDRDRPDEHWTQQFPRLMKHLGARTHVVPSARQAFSLASRITFHAVFVDLATPVDSSRPCPGEADLPGAVPSSPRSSGGQAGGGLWLLQVMQRLEKRPPVVVVNSRATRLQAARLLSEAMRLGAFSVVNRPVELNNLLIVAQRLLNRHHQGHWPEPTDPQT
ncbi:MAG: hypothetical protein AAGG38_01530 [Planctomycetota bacterium]